MGRQCSSVQFSAMLFSSVQCSAVQSSPVQFSAVQCYLVQCSAVECNVVQSSAWCWPRGVTLTVLGYQWLDQTYFHPITALQCTVKTVQAVQWSEECGEDVACWIPASWCIFPTPRAVAGSVGSNRNRNSRTKRINRNNRNNRNDRNFRGNMK